MPKRLSPTERKGAISAKEKARRSGLKAVGSRGGRATLAKHGKEYMSAIGKKGWMVFVARHFAGDAKAAMDAIQDKAHFADMLQAIRRRENRRNVPDVREDDISAAYLMAGLPVPADLDPYCDGGIVGVDETISSF